MIQMRHLRKPGRWLFEAPHTVILHQLDIVCSFKPRYQPLCNTGAYAFMRVNNNVQFFERWRQTWVKEFIFCAFDVTEH